MPGAQENCAQRIEQSVMRTGVIGVFVHAREVGAWPGSQVSDAWNSTPASWFSRTPLATTSRSGVLTAAIPSWRLPWTISVALTVVTQPHAATAHSGAGSRSELQSVCFNYTGREPRAAAAESRGREAPKRPVKWCTPQVFTGRRSACGRCTSG
jgi:hypothetical protein